MIIALRQFFIGSKKTYREHTFTLHELFPGKNIQLSVDLLEGSDLEKWEPVAWKKKKGCLKLKQ